MNQLNCFINKRIDFITMRMKAYPIKKLLLELKKETGQSEITTMRHLQICKEKRLLDYDDENVYCLCGSF